MVAQPLNQRLGRRLMHLGEAITIVGYVGFILTLHWAGDSVGTWSMAPSLALSGLGLGLTMAPFFDIVLAGVEDHESGSASGVLTSLQQLGGAFGIAVMGTMFFHTLAASDATTRIGAFRQGATQAMWLSTGLVAVAFLLTFLLPMRAREDAVGH